MACFYDELKVKPQMKTIYKFLVTKARTISAVEAISASDIGMDRYGYVCI